MQKAKWLWALFLVGLAALCIGCNAELGVEATATPAPASPTPLVPTATTVPPTSIPTATSVPPTQTATAPATTVPPTRPATRAPTAAGAGQTINLRTVNWNQFLASDPNLDHPAIPPPSFQTGPYVAVKNNSPQNSIMGYAMTDGILYLSFSDDGKEEAVISLFSGGTGGNFGLLVYKAGPKSPVLTAYLGGYKIGATAEGHQLLVTEPVYAGWEPNCCPSGISQTRYRLQGDQLVAQSRTVQGIPGMRKVTVDQFYQLLAEKKYQQAYAFLSPAFQAAQPYNNWRAGYDNTLSFQAQTSEQPDGSIAVNLTAMDQSGSSTVTQHLRGAWTLVWSDAAKQWLLDRGVFNPAP